MIRRNDGPFSGHYRKKGFKDENVWCSKDKSLSNYEVKLYLERVLIINGDNVKRVLNEC